LNSSGNQKQPAACQPDFISLIGYRGCGKTSVAHELAQLLNWETVDSDQHVESSIGKSIRSIFELAGEPAFRQYERAAIVDLLARRYTILSTGGGAILQANTRADLKTRGPVIWLTATPNTIRQRLSLDPATSTQRPALTSQGVSGEIEQILATREPLYRECATHQLSTDDQSPRELAAEIVSFLGLSRD
jgi:shikimate kinase